ncbi:hypothetical protein L3Y34_013172 [Caenorhabditis briggsae]|uniref:Protein kinase domain-containing protein n=1 Tax=Caenorhabditis briggsae TaxID=6238 RepID=A0AAE8ZT48_CAEBR|nr:hypothetical protein L3Y34_013172 [Caenorhabditis briggsae]
MYSPQIFDSGTILKNSLKAAYKKMYIHRDIKRENIFVHRSGHIKLAEFVLVRRMPRGESLNNPCGTHYSPEMKQAPISYGLPADVWAVGIVMYEPGKLCMTTSS